VKPDGLEHREHVLCCIHDALCMSAKAAKSMERIQDDFKLKDDKTEPPGVCLRATLAKMKLENGKTCWTMSPK
jgi:hypothetical protein